MRRVLEHYLCTFGQDYPSGPFVAFWRWRDGQRTYWLRDRFGNEQRTKG